MPVNWHDQLLYGNSRKERAPSQVGLPYIICLTNNTDVHVVLPIWSSGSLVKTFDFKLPGCKFEHHSTYFNLDYRSLSLPLVLRM